jgi:fatty acid desaturase
MLQKFRSDPRYLLRYYGTAISVLLPTCALMVLLRSPARSGYFWYLPAIVMTVVPRFPVIAASCAYAVTISVTVQRASFSPWHLLLVPMSLVLALVATSYIHNAAHDNIRPRWLRRPIGELCALFHLVGFPDWTIVHFIHHRHADDPEMDPHPPAGLSYWRFLNGVKDSIFGALSRRYFDQFGADPVAARAWRQLPLYAFVTQLCKTHFWFLLLGGQSFAFLFLTSIVAKNLHYAFFNYATHVASLDDPSRVIIVNLDDGIFRVINALSHNLYLHKNHHAEPALFDPGRRAVEESRAASQERGVGAQLLDHAARSSLRPDRTLPP